MRKPQKILQPIEKLFLGREIRLPRICQGNVLNGSYSNAKSVTFSFSIGKHKARLTMSIDALDALKNGDKISIDVLSDSQ